MKSLALLLALAPIALGTVTGQRQFKTSTNAVRLEVGVTVDGASIEGLTAADFALDDRSVRQTIRVEEMKDASLDLMLAAPPLAAVDLVAADQTNRFLAGVTAFLDQIQDRDRLGVVLAGSPPRPVQLLAPGRAHVATNFVRSATDSYSASFDAIALAARMFDTSDRRRVVVAFTNTADFRSALNADAIVELAKRLDNALVLVGLPVAINRTVTAVAETASASSAGTPVEGTIRGFVLPIALENFAKATSSQLINLSDAPPSVTMKRLFESLRTYYVVTYDMPEGKGWHPVKVKVNRRGAKVAVRQGYFVD